MKHNTVAGAILVHDYHHGPCPIDLTDGGTLICDIDGTVSDTSHRQHYVTTAPKNWDAFFRDMHLDGVIADFADAVRTIHAHPAWSVVLCTGRDERHRATTVEWFARQGIPYDALYMRPAGDRRDDTFVKRTLLAEIRRDSYRPVLAFEDRARVVQMWRDEGIRCVQVAEGNF